MRDNASSRPLPVGTRVTNQRHGFDGIVASEPFRESPDGSDRRARVLVAYIDEPGDGSVDYVRDLQVADGDEWMAKLSRLAAMSCNCDAFNPCQPCAASRRAAAYERAASSRSRHEDRRPEGLG